MTLLTCGLPFVALGFVVAFAKFFSNVQLYGGFFCFVFSPTHCPPKSGVKMASAQCLEDKSPWLGASAP